MEIGGSDPDNSLLGGHLSTWKCFHFLLCSSPSPSFSLILFFLFLLLFCFLFQSVLLARISYSLAGSASNSVELIEQKGSHCLAKKPREVMDTWGL